jgi:hypothetical protein
MSCILICSTCAKDSVRFAGTDNEALAQLFSFTVVVQPIDIDLESSFMFSEATE